MSAKEQEKEMSEKAQHFVAKWDVSANGLEGVICQFHEPHMWQYRFVLKMKIKQVDGYIREFVEDFTVEQNEIQYPRHLCQVRDLVADKLKGAITNIIMQNLDLRLLETFIVEQSHPSSMNRLPTYRQEALV